MECAQVVVACPHACNSVPIMRRDVGAHLSTCPSKPVACGFSGCPKIVRRGGEEKGRRERMGWRGRGEEGEKRRRR